MLINAYLNPTNNVVKFISLLYSRFVLLALELASNPVPLLATIGRASTCV
jgi:hypothetical protein